MQDNTLYGYTLAEHEYQTTLPVIGSDDQPVVIAISAHGGGTAGESYADNGWDYVVYADGSEIISGQDLRSGGMGATHAEMARVLCSFLSADAESLNYMVRGFHCEDAGRLDVYDDVAREFLSAEGERLGLFASELS
jgi:hypothetical protein